ncbi:MAG: hypothetical protein COT71_03085 [Candidatus Andersenbacteria bacterium CG10_big_fil_rev_8_21_14_0_10_54_11]|uniref:tRNA dimethylallyltransferase n=1 Tax=Candidatus Andersenbacteria bacterium CG10_big_fil_rev_8_21_14_0_10_54_11 TaxID=1974485 RepID=A0A2M6WYY8_9BACT|nr:MAG: hypothetical protein COT71_03085 [Candidatus Andersenbacteria bacterium CG10_big_fil_rev_8_21_14_0_10_54_11]
MTDKQRILAVIGPTGSGKTAVSVALAKKQANVAVVSADSRQVYAGMDVGTAKSSLAMKSRTNKTTPDQSTIHDAQNASRCEPHDIFTPNVIEGVPHYLQNIRRPDELLTLAEWQEAAYRVLEYLVELGYKNKEFSPTTPAAILAGGTMLYVDSIVYNYEIPPVPPDAALRAELEARPSAELYAELIQKDPAAAGFIQPKNARRIIRAIEVIAKTGRPFSASRRKREAKYDVQMIGLFPGWEELERRLRGRAEQMLFDGLMEETQRLIDRYGRDFPLLQTINYKQALSALAGKMTEREAVTEMTRVNLRYARRQMSWWFRKTPSTAGPRGRSARKEIRWFRDPVEAFYRIPELLVNK